MQHYIEFWTRYFDFSGRTTRAGYWTAWLFNLIVSLAIGLVVRLLPALAVLSTIFSIATIIPGLSICVRRLRDAGKNWGWIFINFLPLIGTIIFLVFLCQPSVGGYQASPYAQDNAGSSGYDF